MSTPNGVNYRKFHGNPDAPNTYAVELDGERIGTVTAPIRDIGEREWEGRLDADPKRVHGDTRDEVAELLVRYHRIVADRERVEDLVDRVATSKPGTVERAIGDAFASAWTARVAHAERAERVARPRDYGQPDVWGARMEGRIEGVLELALGIAGVDDSRAREVDLHNALVDALDLTPSDVYAGPRYRPESAEVTA